MKNNFLLLVLMLYAFSGITQLPIKLKYDNLFYFADSSLVLIKNKKKHSLFDTQADKYVFQNSVDHFIYLQGADAYARIGKDKKSFVVYYKSDSLLWNFFSSNAKLTVGFAEPPHNKTDIYVNGINIKEVDNDNELYRGVQGDFWQSLEVVWLNQHLIKITDYQNYSSYDQQDYSGYSHSGIYDYTNGKWIIPNTYHKCYVVNDYVFALKIDYSQSLQGDIFVSTEKHTYDLFVLNGLEVELRDSNITEVDENLLAQVLNVDSAIKCNDFQHYIIHENQKQGMIRFQLMDEFWEGYSKFMCQEILPLNSDLIVFHPQHKKVISVHKDSSNRVTLWHYVDGILDENNNVDELRKIISDCDWVSYKSPSLYYETYDEYFGASNLTYELDQQFGDPSIVAIHEHNGYKFHDFSAEMEDDSLVLIEHFFRVGQEPEPLKSIIFPDMDSIDVNGNIVYYDELEDQIFSGVFNLNSGKWILSTQDPLILSFGNGFISGDGKKFNEWNSNGELLAVHLYDDLIRDTSALKKIFDECTSIIKAPNGVYNHSKSGYDIRAYYFVTDEGYELYKPELDFGNKYCFGIKDFIHFNPDLQAMFLIENDSLQFTFGNHIYNISLENGTKIELFTNLHSIGDTTAYSLRIIDNQGNQIESVGSNFRSTESQHLFSLLIENDYLIINDYGYYDFSYYSDELLERYVDFRMECENSVVWKKENQVWKKYSPYYAKIFPVGENFFIAKSGTYFLENIDEMTGVHISSPARYFLLDSNLNAKQFMDFYDFPLIEDLGFGIKICLDKGCFFMTYAGEIITGADWDDFEKINNKKMKAILHQKLEVDEDGNLILNQYGMPNEIVTKTEKFFTLP